MKKKNEKQRSYDQKQNQIENLKKKLKIDDKDRVKTKKNERRIKKKIQQQGF